MRGNLFESVVQIVLLLIYGVAALFSAAVGLFFEYQSVLYAVAGEYSMAGWLALLGGVGLFFAFLFVREKILAHAAALRRLHS